VHNPVHRVPARAEIGEVPIEVGEMIVKGLVADALMVGAMGLIGTAFCIGAQSEAKRIAKARSVGADRLVERLEELLGESPQSPQG